MSKENETKDKELEAKTWPRIHGIKAFISSSLIDWPNRISSVIFLGSCNLRCFYCHNLDVVRETLPDIEFSKIMNSLLERKDYYRNVVISGGEPTNNYKRLLYLCRILKREGFFVKIDTNLTRPFVLRELIEKNLIDYVSADVKAPLSDESKFKKVVSEMKFSQNLIKNVKESLIILRDSKIDYELRMTIDENILTLKDYERTRKDVLSLGLKDLKLQRARSV